MASRRVAIIGGGSAGIAQAQELLDAGFQPTIFERRDRLGSGVWALDDEPGKCEVLFDEGGRAYPRWEETEERRWPPSAIYPGLRTNISYDLMTYRDSPFRETSVDGPFPNRDAVEGYLMDWAQSREGVTRNARMDTVVTSVRRIRDPPPTQTSGSDSLWKVDSRHLWTGEETSEEFGYIVIASGRCSIPSIAPIPGLWNFQGTISHSAWYRTPTIYRGKKVVVVGNNSSGFDICRELQGHIVRDFAGKEEWVQDVKSGSTGVEIINSIEDIKKAPGMDYDPLDEASPEWCRRIKVVPRISRVQEDGSLLLEDGQQLRDVDVIIFATGFYIQYDFLHHDEEPFRSVPIVDAARKAVLTEEDNARLQRRIEKQRDGRPFKTATPANTGPSNLDDWYLLYAGDKSVAILGLPTATIPFPTAQMQARYIAAYWAGKASELPPLDRTLPPSDASRWSKPLSLTKEQLQERGHIGGPMPLIFSSPSDSDYLDGLLRYIPGAGGPPPWQEKALHASQHTLEQPNGHLSSPATVEDLKTEAATAHQESNKATISKPLQQPAEQRKPFTSEEEARQYYLSTLKSGLMGGTEASYDVTAWRRQRRTENKELRRNVLGY
ncbi:FAD/NAD(P)-binding domain-containing protein [Microstroma glucosiphilum]|uniref:FAD/NAD(P)-binding domain-containing protein n=1 Tax=Pseudomicrostroma glucosiphilum TaxID=1684307 RepID=A0A316U6R7_9BASI|nr:FAD/NAD(P)-binding domain-containing protein [Pseudomicrostroma glucosiphilum]PWN20033.1 FAD/NAD(P)-binding domain-containing protein [Pseudomicrostroma glucosiphilum]